MTNKKIALAMGFVSLFSACSEELANNAKNAAEAREEASVAVLEKGASLSKLACDTANVGEKLFVTDSSATFVCNGKKWVRDSKESSNGTSKVDTIVVSTKDTVVLSNIDTVVVRDTVVGLNGKDGVSCSAEKVETDDRKGVALICGDAVVDTVWDGESFRSSASNLLMGGAHISNETDTVVFSHVDTLIIRDTVMGLNGADGASCSGRTVVKNKRQGVELSCGGVVIDTVWNGKDGKKGKNGEKGEKGERGHDGHDGVGCYGAPFEGGIQIMCGGNYVGNLLNGVKGDKGDAGNDGANCQAKVVDGGVQVICGNSIGFLRDGKDGENCSARSVVNESNRHGTEVVCGGVVVDTLWDGIDGEKGDKGEDGTSCTAQSAVDGEGRTGLLFVCGGKKVGFIMNGKDGIDGTSCTGKAVQDGDRFGLEMTCGNEVIGTVWDGVDGKDLIAENGSVLSFVDTRDGHEYKTVVIGEQTWMAENLKYEPNKLYEHWCYEDKDANCEKYGRLYAKHFAKADICPDGWHIPTKDEWMTLIDNAGGIKKAGSNLMGSGWSMGEPKNLVGFNAIPAGFGHIFVADGDLFYMDNFDGENETAKFMYSGDDFGSVVISNGYEAIGMESEDDEDELALSIRCVKNN